MKKIEILAPAGSYESMVGAINAGADAVYMGGPLFGARAFADNPMEDRLLQAIDDVHLHGKKLYLTVNTLLKGAEIDNRLYEYLRPLYEQGLDAVIVQDMGALTAIRQWFPDLDIHASTQMTVVSAAHARSLKALGVTRIVPARELGFNEIRKLKQDFGGEIECFVHGALCYCYSGQCLLSSMLGGRSGNRGRCAQPCRLPYRLSESGKTLGSTQEPYLLSPKDICTLDLVPQMIECGIDSFKIEGRMKKPEYAALVSHIYRKYTDMYLNYGLPGYQVENSDREALMDIYNRGGFSKGYYKQHNGRDMMSLTKPNHFGTYVGKIAEMSGNTARFSSKIQLNQADVLIADGLSDKETATLKMGCTPGAACTAKFPKKVSVGSKIYRLRNESLIRDIREKFLTVKNQENIYVSFTLLKDFPAKMHLKWGEISVDVAGSYVTAALNQPLSEATVREKAMKTGNTPYHVKTLDIHMDPDIYLPMQALNQLRRDGIEALTAAVLNVYRRTSLPKGGVVLTLPAKDVLLKKNIQADCRVLISDLAMQDSVLSMPRVTRIYLESWLMGSAGIDLAVKKIHQSGREVYMAMPYIFRENSRTKWEDYKELFKTWNVDGYLVRNMESLEFLKVNDLLRSKENVVSDYTLYGMNCYARHYYYDQGIAQTCVPMELNYKELRQIGCESEEMVVYGYIPLMISAQCLNQTVRACTKRSSQQQLIDRYGKSLNVKNICSDCYNLIYNSQPLVLYDMEKELSNLHPAAVRYNFTNESPEMIRKILSDDRVTENFTRGHFNRGVE